MNVDFRKLTEPTTEIAACFTRWQNDPKLIHLIRPSQDQASLEKLTTVTVDDLEEWLGRKQIYMIYLQDWVVGNVQFQVDPKYLYKKDVSTAWVGIMIGEEDARGKGIGYLALQYLEEEVKAHGIHRLELGVFEFNTNAIKLYQKMGYQEIGCIPHFTYWQGKRWADIRMEKII